MNYQALIVLEGRPDVSLFRTALVSRRSCLTFAAAHTASASGADRGKSRKYGEHSSDLNGSLRGDHFGRTMGPPGDAGNHSPAFRRTLPKGADSPSSPPGPSLAYPNYDFNAGRLVKRSGGEAGTAAGAAGGSFRPPAPSSTPGSNVGGRRRSDQERAARKAARLADKAAAAARNSQGCCYGCGAMLQTEVPVGAGYVAPDKYAVRKQRRQLDKVLCQRCSELCNGAMIPAVQDFNQKLQLRQLMGEAAPGSGVGAVGASASEAAGDRPAAADSSDASTSLLGKVLVSPEQLRGQLKTLALRAAVVVLLVDLTDAYGSLMARVRDMVGRNPIVMVGTKMDLLPEGCRPGDVADWLSGAAASKKLNLVSVHLVSSHTGEGMSAAVSAICSERKSRDVYVVGAANVGKSAFVRAMLKEMARTDPAAIGMGKYLPVESAMPGTTLGLIPLRAFSSGGILFDTPGVHLHHRIPHMLSPTELKLLHPRRRLAAFVPPLPVELAEAEEEEANASGSGATDPRVGSDVNGESSLSGDGHAGAIGSDSEGAVRRGRGGLKIVDYAPTDAYGVPIIGFDAGVRRPSGGRGADPWAGRPTSRSDGGGGGLTVKGPQTVRATYMWSDLVRIDVLSGPPSTALVFYGPSTMRAVGLPYIPSDRKLQVDYIGDSNSGSSNSSSSSSNNVLVCTDSVAMRGGLQPKEMLVRANGAAGSTAPLSDVAVSGLPGWVSVWAPRAKQDVRLRVWAPRGVEVMLRPALPCPMPRTLERALGGERGRGGAEGDRQEGDEEPAELGEWSRALADGVGDPTADPAWWEAMAALKDEDLPGYDVAVAARTGRRSTSSSSRPLNGANGRGQSAGRWAAVGISDTEDGGAVPGGGGDDDDDDDLPDWNDEAEVLDDGDEEEVDEERVVVTARVEDILKRPRLDVLGQMDLGLANGDDEDQDENDEAAEDDDEDDEEGIASFTLTKSSGSRRRRDGPAADGMWDPLATTAVVPAAMLTPRRRSAGSAGARGQAAATSAASLRSPAAAAASRSRDVAAAEGEQEEEVPEAAWSETAGAGVESEEELAVLGSAAGVRGGGRRAGRRRLGRHRKVVQVAVVSEEEEGEVE
ncbi:hypothetical protein Vretimale_6458 [Volvox reticuliferus]|uniref:Uncharacterized protein n=2 Tax=Volvox reticuliferus TaxID=1737510 RepID=A0A8J4CEW0_9CHLO|nr:hypothetical protein Vretifemale_7421 [Volvox reticuliferus]GIM01722.1 hypothetical protein Vretimale_6458 [Volvox reticuliferus]